MNDNSFQSKIKKYADELMRMNRESPSPALQTEAESTEEISEEISVTEEEIKEDSEEEAQENNEENDEAEKPAPEGELTDFAFFSARVFTGKSAYPVENARVIVTKDDKLFTYMSTDSDGATGKARLPAYPRENSLNPESDRQAVEYRAEVYAVGFSPRKNLLISATGGSDIVLNIQMTPLSERMN